MMKKICKILMLAVLALMICAVMASCGTSGTSSSTGSNGTSGSNDSNGTSGSNDSAGTSDSGNTVITETTNDAADAEISEFSVGYLTEGAYNNGNFTEDTITKTVDFADREAKYMVVDLKIKTLIANSGERSVKITVQSADASVLYMMVQDAPTGNFEPFGNREGYHLVYSILTTKGEEKAVRMILKLIPSKNSGDVNVSISVSGADDAAVSGKTGATTAFFIPSNLIFTLNNGEYIVSGLGTTDDTTITIPATYKGKPVTGIGDEAFKNCNRLTSIEIPDSVTSMGDSAFYGCNSLTSMTIPFAGNTTNGKSNTHFGYIFGASKSSENSKYIPSSLKTVLITGGSSIGDLAFYDCGNLTSVTIGNGVTSIGDYAFEGCSSLTSISVNENNAYYCSENGVLFNKDKTTLICYPEGKTETSYSIPDSVMSIGEEAFYGCVGLTGIAIPDSVTNIGGAAFYDCNGLTSIVIPESVISIGKYAFYGCNSLTSMTIPFAGNTANGKSNTHFGYIFGANSYSDHNQKVPSSLKTVVIVGRSGIGSYAFFGCSNLTSITISGGVTSIGEYAFYGCVGLTSSAIPDSVTNIGDGAFSDCSGLTSVTISGGVTSIGKYAFNNCDNLTSIVIPDSVTSIGEGAFYECRNLRSITLPFVGNTANGTSNTHFGYIFGALSHSDNNLKIPSSLHTAVITGGSSIDSCAFFNCHFLKSIVIPDSVTSVGDGAFDGCLDLKSIAIPEGVTSIGEDAFDNCRNLKNIVIPDSVTSIGDFAFSSCSSLTSIQFGGTVAQWKSITFGSYWNSVTGNYTITCTDGTIAK